MYSMYIILQKQFLSGTEIFNNAKSRMSKAIEYCAHEISQIRTGRASINILDESHITCLLYSFSSIAS